MTASTEVEQIYRQRKSWIKLIELLLSRTEFLGDPKERIQLLVQIAEIYEEQLGDRDSAFVTLQAAFREDYSQRPRGQGAGAPGHRGGQVERAAVGLHPGGAEHRRPAPGGGPVGEDRPLVRQRGQPHRLRHRLAPTRRCSWSRTTWARCRRWRTSTGSSRSGASWWRCWPATPRCWSPRSRPQQVEILLALADTYETQLGDAAQAMLAYQQALDVDERCMEAIDALERLYRRTQAWDRLVDVLQQEGPHRRRRRAGDQAAAAGGRAVGGAAGGQRPGGGGLQGGADRRSAEHRRP